MPHDGIKFKPIRNSKTRIINAVDLFCGAGGTSTGLIDAVNSLGMDIQLTAINHWDIAIATHTKNHEDVNHFCQSIESLNPTDIIKGGRLDLLVASPECTHHSRARGGKPRSDQKRADAWLLMRWIEKLYIENILIENVKEFEEWGPLTVKGKPDKRYKGMYFKQFIDALRINYTVDWTTINCADHGDPTTRQRFFLIAKRGKKKKIVWPQRTHASRKELVKLAAAGDPQAETLQPWVPAREIIDWSLEGRSIFGRKTPLKPNTMRRIFAGLKKYSGIDIGFADEDGKEPPPGRIILPKDLSNISPFIVPQFSSPDTRGVDVPLGAITTTSRGVGLAETQAFQLNLKGTTRRDRDIDDPTFTQAAGGNHQGVVEAEPFLIKNFGGEDETQYRAKSLDDPLGTVLATRNHHSLVEPETFVFNMAHSGQMSEGEHAGRCADVDKPLNTIAGKGMFGLVEAEPFMITGGRALTNRSAPRSVSEPVATITGTPNIGVVETEFISSYHGGPDGDNRNYSIDEPVSTLDTSNRYGVVAAEPIIVSAAHGGNTNPARDVNEPLGTVLGSNKYAVAEPFVLNMQGDHPQNSSVEDPVPTLLTGNHKYVVEPCVVNMKGQSKARSVDEPTFTQTGKQHQYVVEPFVLGQQSGSVPCETGEPVPTIAGSGAISLVEPFIVKFYSAGENADSVDDPLATVTGKDRFGLCIPHLGVILDIRFRMLQPHELAAAMSFRKDYEFTGTREQKVKQIGNAVPRKTAKALAKAILMN